MHVRAIYRRKQMIDELRRCGSTLSATMAREYQHVAGPGDMASGTAAVAAREASKSRPDTNCIDPRHYTPNAARHRGRLRGRITLAAGRSTYAPEGKAARSWRQTG